MKLSKQRAALNRDPTRTTLLRRRFEQEVKKRWRLLIAKVKHLVGDQDAFGLDLPRPVANTMFSYDTSEGKLKRFRSWLRNEMGSTLAGDALIQKYIDESYTRGTARSFRDLRRIDKTALTALTDGTTTGPSFPPGTTPSEEETRYLRMRASRGATVQKVKLLAGRTFAEMEDVSAKAGTRMSRVLVEALVNGYSAKKTARLMSEQAEIEMDRALVVVRTEMVRAHAEGQLDMLSEAGARVRASVEWETAGDGKACPKCSRHEGNVFAIDDARGMIPAHPNCRCAWIPVREE